MESFFFLARADLERFVTARGFPSFHARSMLRWVYGKGCVDFSAMSNVPAGLRAAVADSFSTENLRVQERLVSADKSQKLLIALTDGNSIEAVLIPARGRITGCLSSQAGCAFGCRFCASGQSGLKRNLSSAEIIEEVFLLRRMNEPAALTHLVFMGTGEPLDNYDEVLEAIRRINAVDFFGIGARRITLSTCGIVPGILRLAEEPLQIELSVSLHAAEDALRSKLMPVNKRYPLCELIASCREYVRRKKRQVTFEYVLMDGINADAQSARRLAALLQQVPLAKVNLIPANPGCAAGIVGPSGSQVRLFQKTLAEGKIPATVRVSRGADIAAACGQLRARYEKK